MTDPTAAPAPPLAPALDPPASPWLAAPALEQARAIRDGRLRSEELVALYLERIDALDPRLGAFVHLRGRAALREAAALDREARQGRFRGPLHGVPTGIKDLHPLAGAPLRFGSRAWRYLVSPFDDRLVSAVRRAGMPILGKTSTSELALLPVVETDIHPPTRNPWDLERSAGGSSGGAGAALAAGLLPIAPGSDGAGSIRIPAALCGVLGLKPTRGLVPDDARAIDPHGLTAIGPMGRDARDLAALLDLLTRPGGLPTPVLEEVARPPAGLRIGLLLEPPFGACEPGVQAAVEALGRRLEALGHRLVPRPRLRGEVAEFAPIYQAIFARIPVLFPGKLQPVTRAFRDQGRGHRPEEVARRVEALSARGLQALEDVDVLLTPTVPRIAPRVGAHDDLPPEQVFDHLAILGAFTAISNVTGCPALSLPAGWSEGLPVGAQLVARPGEDSLLLALAHALTHS